jgi:polyphosphate kinase 2 (PPK2 family)
MRSVKTRSKSTKNYTVMRNGVIKVGQRWDNILDEYKPAKIPDYLEAVDHTLKIGSKKEYKKHLRKQQRTFNQLVHEMKDLDLALVVALQGRDGAGKTGTNSCLFEALWKDSRIFKSVPMGKPTPEELSYPYLWRMGKYDNYPAKGQVRVYDRCWQERVLVERVRKLTPEQKLRESYTELRHFEWGMSRHNTVLVKLWLDITYEEQGRRFEQRVADKPEKKSKEDDIARGDWHEYTPAANEMFHRTGTKDNPQYIVSSEDKKYCHITMLEVINHEMRKAIKATRAEKRRDEKK